MKQKEIITMVSIRHRVTQAKAKAIHDEIFALISESLLRGNRVRVKDFGTFESVNRAERMGRDPRNGKQILIKASKSVKFKLSKAIKDKLNG